MFKGVPRLNAQEISSPLKISYGAISITSWKWSHRTKYETKKEDGSLSIQNGIQSHSPRRTMSNSGFVQFIPAEAQPHSFPHHTFNLFGKYAFNLFRQDVALHTRHLRAIQNKITLAHQTSS